VGEFNTRAFWSVYVFVFAVCGGCTTVVVLPVEHDAEFRRGEAAYLKGEYTEASGAFSDYVRRQTNPAAIAEGLYWQGMCRLARREFGTAAELFEKSLSEQAAEKWVIASALSGLGAAHMGRGKFDAASKAYTRAFETGGDDIRRDEVLFRLGLCFQRTGQWEKAEANFSRVLKEMPDSQFAEQALEQIDYGRDKVFCVQVGAYEGEQAAAKRVAQLNEMGLEAYVKKIVRAGKPLYCVRIGKFSEWAEANVELNRLRGMERIDDAIVKP
jgi:tetratricopeptide (TPR) repeat protein